MDPNNKTPLPAGLTGKASLFNLDWLCEAYLDWKKVKLVIWGIRCVVFCPLVSKKGTLPGGTPFSFNKHLLHVYQMPGPMPTAGNRLVRNIQFLPYELGKAAKWEF